MDLIYDSSPKWWGERWVQDLEHLEVLFLNYLLTDSTVLSQYPPFACRVLYIIMCNGCQGDKGCCCHGRRWTGTKGYYEHNIGLVFMWGHSHIETFHQSITSVTVIYSGEM